MFEGDYADTYGGHFLLVSMGDRAEGLACPDPGVKTPIGGIGNFFMFCCLRQYVVLSAGLWFLLLRQVCLKSVQSPNSDNMYLFKLATVCLVKN